MSDLLSRTVTSNLEGVKSMRHKPKHSTHHSPADSTDANAESHRWLLPVLLVAQLMVILDITAVNIALPRSAADLLGRRRMLLTGLAVFTGSSLASAMAGSAAVLFASRAGQGLGAAILSPAALSIITSVFHGSQRAKALSAWGAVGGAGAAIGVLVGGLLTEFGDWRMIFYVNLPVAAALAITTLKIVPAETKKPRWRGLDLRG